MARVGFTNIAISLAIEGLVRKGFADKRNDSNDYGHEYPVFAPCERGIQWLMQNQEQLVLKSSPPDTKQSTVDGNQDVPF